MYNLKYENEREIKMTIYLCAFALMLIGLIVYYFISKNNVSSKRVIHYGIDLDEKNEYTEAAERCKKNNSPVSNEPFNELFLEGSNIVNMELFTLSDEGCDIDVI